MATLDIWASLNSSSGTIIAIATVVYGVASIAMVWALLRGNDLSRKIVANQSRPRIHCSLTRSSPTPSVELENRHVAPAFDVSLRINESRYDVGYIGPNGNRSVLLHKDDASARANVQLTYKCELGSDYQDEFSL